MCTSHMMEKKKEKKVESANVHVKIEIDDAWNIHTHLVTHLDKTSQG